MASSTNDQAQQAAWISDDTRSMFRAVFEKNGVINTEDAILEQEIVMFFKLGEHYLYTNHDQINTFTLN